MKNAKMINYGEMVFTQAQRVCTCKGCNERMTQGTPMYKYMSSIQPKGMAFCFSCYKAMTKDFIGTFSSSNTYGNSKITKNHILTVRGFINDFPYFRKNHLCDNVKVNGEVADYSSYNENRYTSGHVIGTAFEHNWRVWIDGVEIFNFEDLDAITR